MTRREFIGLLGGTAVACPLAARAQQSDRVQRIGVLMGLAEDDPETKARLAGFRQGLEKRGWFEGRNVRVDYRFAPAGDQAQVLAKELVALQPDVIVPRPELISHTDEPCGAVGAVDQIVCGKRSRQLPPRGRATLFAFIAAPRF